MRLLHILPYAAMILLAEAAAGSVPAIVAAREGGMGLGSALIVGQASQVAGIALGAVVAAHLVDRRSIHAALIVGALLYYGGLIGVGHQPAHLLGWVVVILALAGAGLGMVLTAAFSAAAGLEARERPFGVALVLLAPLAAQLLAGNPVFQAGITTLVVLAAVVVGGSVFIAWSGRGSRAVLERAPRPDQGLGAGVALAGGGLLAIGVLATLLAIEPSRVSAALLAGALGAGFASLDGVRLGLLLVGLLAVGAGVALLWVRARPSRATVAAAAASASAALAVAGLVAVAGFAMPRELSIPDSRGGAIGELAALLGGAAGLGSGAWLLARGMRSRTVAMAGALLLAVLSVALFAGDEVVLRSSGFVGPIVAIAATALGGGLTAVALRVVLAEAPIAERGLAASAGVAAAAFGAMVGLMLGAAEGGTRAIGAAAGISVGSIVLVAAALVAVGVVAALPTRRAADATPGRRAEVAAG